MYVYQKSRNFVSEKKKNIINHLKQQQTMKKYFVQYTQTEAGLQPYLRSLSKGSHWIYQYETTDLQEALKVARKEIETTDLTKIEDLEYDLTDREYNLNVSRIDVLQADTDEDGEEIIDWVDFDSPGFWVE